MDRKVSVLIFESVLQEQLYLFTRMTLSSAK